MERPTPDQLHVFGQQRACNDVLDRDGEALPRVRVCRGGGEPVAEPKLRDRLRRLVRRQLPPAADDAAAEVVALDVHASFEALGKEARDRRLAGRHRAGDEVDGTGRATRSHGLRTWGRRRLMPERSTISKRR